MKTRLGSPLGVDFKITNRCNLACRHCLAESGSASEDELSAAECFALIDDLAAERVFYLGITGGEPLTAPHLWAVLEHARERGLLTGITTNGTLIDRHTADRLHLTGCSLARVSLDGHNAQYNDTFRGVRGAFDAACEGIRNLVAAGVDVTILTVVSRRNLNSWEAMIEVAEELGVRSLNAYVFVPGGRGAAMADEALRPNEYRDFLERVSSCQTRGGGVVNLLSDTPLLAVAEKAIEGSTCPAGTSELFIKEDGEVTPCPYFSISLGNVRAQRLAEIWMHPLLRSLREESSLASECRVCDFATSCHGGCRAAAYASGGTISAPDPYCWLVKSGC